MIKKEMTAALKVHKRSNVIHIQQPLDNDHIVLGEA